MAVNMNNEILKEEKAIIRERRELEEATYHNQALEKRESGAGG